jgi:hypothetical protein
MFSVITAAVPRTKINRFRFRNTKRGIKNSITKYTDSISKGIYIMFTKASKVNPKAAILGIV